MWTRAKVCAKVSSVRTPYAGMAGVYDVGKHYRYEAGRGVAHLSTMARAVGGHGAFAAHSPAAILAHAAPPKPRSRGTPRCGQPRIC